MYRETRERQMRERERQMLRTRQTDGENYTHHMLGQGDRDREPEADLLRGRFVLQVDIDAGSS
mgnify:CR=1 FL=1